MRTTTSAKVFGLQAMILFGILLSAQATCARVTATAGGQPADAKAISAPASGAPLVSVLSHDDLQCWLDGLMPYALKSGDVAGAVVVVVKDGQVLFQQGYGYADVASHRRVDAETTLFRPGSISKTFLWTAVMQLVEQGKINLDQDVNTYLDFKISPYEGRPITMRDLMTHSPGFEESYRDLFSTPEIGVPDFRTVMTQQVPNRIYPPGQIPAYSNYGAALAGYIVQRVSGQRFDDYIAQHILAPLDMQHSSFRQPLPTNLRPLMSSGYDLASQHPKPYEVIGPYPAGSLAATGADMGKWMIAQLQNGEYQGRHILQPATAKMMHDTEFVPINPVLEQGVLGFSDRIINGHRTIGHDGNTQWFHSQMNLFLDDDVGIFVSVNTRGRGYAALGIESQIVTTFANRYFPASPAVPRQTVGVDEATARVDAAKLAGDYNASETHLTSWYSLLNLTKQIRVIADSEGHVTVEQPPGSFAAINEGKASKAYEEVAPFVWSEIGGDGRIAAKVRDGKVLFWSPGWWRAMLPIPFYKNGDWLWPLLNISIAVLLLTSVLWPVSAAVRQYYKVPFTLSGTKATSYRLVRVSALASGLLMYGWVRLVTTTMDINESWQSYMIPRIMAMEILSILIFPAAAAIAIWNARIVWTTRSGRDAMLERGVSIILIIATLTVLWVAVVFHLISLRPAF